MEYPVDWDVGFEAEQNGSTFMFLTTRCWAILHMLRLKLAPAHCLCLFDDIVIYISYPIDKYEMYIREIQIKSKLLRHIYYRCRECGDEEYFMLQIIAKAFHPYPFCAYSRAAVRIEYAYTLYIALQHPLSEPTMFKCRLYTTSIPNMYAKWCVWHACLKPTVGRVIL